MHRLEQDDHMTSPLIHNHLLYSVPLYFLWHEERRGVSFSVIKLLNKQSNHLTTLNRNNSRLILQSLRQALHRIFTQNQILPLQNIIHIGSLQINPVHHLYKLWVVHNWFQVASRQLELLILLLSVYNQRQVIPNQALQHLVHLASLHLLPLTHTQHAYLHSAGIHDDQMLLLPFQRQGSS